MLRFALRASGPLSILCLGAHADDIEIGAGGAILTLLETYPESRVHWVVFSAVGARADEARTCAAAFLGRAGESRVMLHDFRDGFFPGAYDRIKETFEEMKPFAPDLIFTHQRADHHQDHRIVCELTWSTFRDHLVLEYEVPKYDPDLGNPNLFVPLEKRCVEIKTGLLMAHFRTQHGRRWFTPDTFEALMRLRGVQGAAPGGFAEAFYAPKLMLA
jgi:LmbE family N-acetylglucosaminyl deacetylase